MADEQALTDLLDRFRSDLAAICGDDLAESLLKAGQSGGAPNLDMQLAINDGLETMDEDQRAEILRLLDAFIAEVKTVQEAS